MLFCLSNQIYQSSSLTGICLKDAPFPQETANEMINWFLTNWASFDGSINQLCLKMENIPVGRTQIWSSKTSCKRPTDLLFSVLMGYYPLLKSLMSKQPK